MNAPANVRPARDRYIPVVAHHVPLCKGRELSLRCSILLLRDQATSAARRCSDEAAGILAEIERIGTHYAFARIPTIELEQLRRHLVMLTTSASGLDMFAYRLAHPERETDAGD